MATFSTTLEDSLHRTLDLANERRQEFATLEHLLLALVDDPDAAKVMTACGADLGRLRRNLINHVDKEPEKPIADGIDDSEPTEDFQRVIQRAVFDVLTSGREEVSGADILVSIFAENGSHAAFFLQEEGLKPYDAVDYMANAGRPGPE
jgi:ATP-dependent Clp protease ATP-binding subunit ClpA